MRLQRGLAWWSNGYETVEGGFDRYRGQYGSEAEANETVAVAAAMAAAMATWTLTWKASSTGGGKRAGARTVNGPSEPCWDCVHQPLHMCKHS